MYNGLGQQAPTGQIVNADGSVTYLYGPTATIAEQFGSDVATSMRPVPAVAPTPVGGLPVLPLALGGLLLLWIVS